MEELDHTEPTEKKKTEKHIYLSDICSKSTISDVLRSSKYSIVDKKDISRDIKDSNVDDDIKKYMIGSEIEKSISRMLRDKKVRQIVYYLYNSNPDKIVKNIEKILPSINSSILVKYYILTEKDIIDREDLSYDRSLYEDILIV